MKRVVALALLLSVASPPLAGAGATSLENARDRLGLSTPPMTRLAQYRPGDPRLRPTWEQCGFGVSCLRPDQRCCNNGNWAWCVAWSARC